MCHIWYDTSCALLQLFKFSHLYRVRQTESWENLLVRITSMPQARLLPCKCKLAKTKALFQNLQSQNGNFSGRTVAPGAVPRGGSALLTAQAQRSLKDYTADCQWGVQSSGLRNQRIRVQGLWVSCPTGDNSNLLEECVRTTIGEVHVPPRHLFTLPAPVKVFIRSCENNSSIMHRLPL